MVYSIRFIAIVAAASLTAAVPATAQTPATEELRITRQEAIALAIMKNPAILAAREQVEQARARVAEATALPDATFETTLEQEKSWFQPGTATAQDLGLGFTIPFPDKIRLSGKVAEASVRAAEFSLTQQRQQLANQTAAAYDALLVALLHSEDLKEAKTLSDDFLKRTQARYDAGTVARLDVIKASVDVAQAQNALIANELDIAKARAGLNRLLARPLGAPVTASEKLEVPGGLPDLATLQRLALASRPEILSNYAQLKGAHDQTTLASRYWLPDISLTLFRNYTEGAPSAYSMAASATLPLFFWQHNNGFIAEARHHEAELTATANDLAAQVGLDVQTSYDTAATAFRQAGYIRDKLLPEAREAFQVASKSYELGGSSALELLDAKRTMLDAEGQYADALGAANDALADLERAVGAPLPPPGEIHEK